MKIGFDAKRALYNNRGLGNYSRTLISSLCNNFPDNEYYLFSTGQGMSAHQKWLKRLKQCRLITPKNPLSKIYTTAWRSIFLSGVVKKTNLDIYHGLSHELPPRIKQVGVSTVVTIHDLLYRRFPQFYPWIDRKVYDKKFRYSVQAADKVIAICEQTKRDCIEYLNCPEEKIEVVYQSCNALYNHHLFYDQKGEIQEKYNLPAKYLLSVGALVENKNFLTVIRALGLIKKRFSIPYIIVGKGEKYKKELLKEVAKQGLEKSVYFIEDVSVQDLVGIYQNASAFIFPSFFEGFGIPIIEALQSGLPVITTRGHCFSESGGPDSLYVDPHSIEEIGSAIETVFDDENLQTKMIKSGREYVQRFSAEKTSHDLMNVYKSLI